MPKELSCIINVKNSWLRLLESTALCFAEGLQPNLSIKRVLQNMTSKIRCKNQITLSNLIIPNSSLTTVNLYYYSCIMKCSKFILLLIT